MSSECLQTFLWREGECLQNAHGIIWSNQHKQEQGQQVTPTLRAMQLRADGNGPHVLLAAGSHLAVIISAQGHQLELLNLPVSYPVLSEQQLGGLSNTPTSGLVAQDHLEQLRSSSPVV